MPEPIAPLACQQHNHQHCIDDALALAKSLCRQRNVQLTPLREQVLRLIWTSHKPLGAYTLMGMLADWQLRLVAPPTVYRALGFLRDQHFIHKIHSLNAFIGCPDPDSHHQSHFLICQQCGVAVECGAAALNQALSETAKAAGFEAQRQNVEILGCCPQCLANRRLADRESSLTHENPGSGSVAT